MGDLSRGGLCRVAACPTFWGVDQPCVALIFFSFCFGICAFSQSWSCRLSCLLNVVGICFDCWKVTLFFMCSTCIDFAVSCFFFVGSRLIDTVDDNVCPFDVKRQFVLSRTASTYYCLLFFMPRFFFFFFCRVKSVVSLRCLMRVFFVSVLLLNEERPFRNNSAPTTLMVFCVSTNSPLPPPRNYPTLSFMYSRKISHTPPT